MVACKCPLWTGCTCGAIKPWAEKLRERAAKVISPPSQEAQPSKTWQPPHDLNNLEDLDNTGYHAWYSQKQRLADGFFNVYQAKSVNGVVVEVNITTVIKRGVNLAVEGEKEFGYDDYQYGGIITKFLRHVAD